MRSRRRRDRESAREAPALARSVLVPAALVALATAACAPEPAPVAEDHAAEIAACAAAVATHVGKPVDAVTAAWTGTSAEGMGIVAVADMAGSGGERVHTCEIDAGGRVRALLHPGA